MIVVSRLAGDALVIDESITVQVVEVDGDTVVLEIDGADGLSIVLGEDLMALTPGSLEPPSPCD